MPAYGTSTTARPPSTPAGTLHRRAARRSRRTFRSYRARSSVMTASSPALSSKPNPPRSAGVSKLQSDQPGEDGPGGVQGQDSESRPRSYVFSREVAGGLDDQAGV